MVKQSLKIIGFILGGMFAVLALTYILLVVYFTDRYNTATYINGVDATGMTPSELNIALSESGRDYSITIEDYDGNSYVINGADIDYMPNYFNDLSSVLLSQNQLTWFFNVVYASAYNVSPSGFNYSIEKLNQALEKVYPFADYDNAAADVHIEKEKGKYILVNETRRVLDKDAAKVLIGNAISMGETEADISGCYSDTIYTSAQKRFVDLFEYIDKYQNTEFNYVDGDLVRRVNYHETNRWLNLDNDGLPYIKDGRLSIDEGKMQDTVESVATIFNTEDDVVKWTRKDGTVADLPYKGNGYKVNTMEEADRILEEIYTGESYERRPIYSQEAMGRGNDIVGKDYVEVDFEHQKMYCYIDGELKLESDCVTGNIRNHCNTPEMVSSIYFMQKGRTLRGENYATFVYYWMAFYNHYGLHDATWRRSFGDDIYLTNGSHGCVNLPKDVAGELYDLVYVGMPVVLYYGENQF